MFNALHVVNYNACNIFSFSLHFYINMIIYKIILIKSIWLHYIKFGHLADAFMGWSQGRGKTTNLQTLLLSSFVIDIIKVIGFVNKPAPLLYRQVCGVAFEGYLSIWMKIATTNPELLMGNECKWFDMTVFKVIEWNTVDKQRVSANLLLVLYLQSLQLFHLYLRTSHKDRLS